MRVLLLVNEDLVPPITVSENENLLKAPWKTEYHVLRALRRLGHSVETVGVGYRVEQIRSAIDLFKPNIVFNLLEQFAGEAIFDQNIVSYLEILGIKYTGCNPAGLIMSRNKALSKKVLGYHKIRSPSFNIAPLAHSKKSEFKLGKLKFPCIVKTLNEEASLGISQKSVVNNLKELNKRISFIHAKFNTSVIVEEYIDGRELYVGVFGNRRIKALPVFELKFKNLSKIAKPIATERVKWSEQYRQKNKITYELASESKPSQLLQVQSIAKKAYKALGLSGYARFDFRLNKKGECYLIEANPNPDIGSDDEFALAAKSDGISYTELIKKIVQLGIRWSPLNFR